MEDTISSKPEANADSGSADKVLHLDIPVSDDLYEAVQSLAAENDLSQSQASYLLAVSGLATQHGKQHMSWTELTASLATIAADVLQIVAALD